MNTRCLFDFSLEQKYELAKLLAALGTTYDRTTRLTGKVCGEYNPQSGLVFLVDQSFHVARLNKQFLEDWYVCPTCFNEGFFEEFSNCDNDCCRNTMASKRH
jgi:hypothetical protein